MRNLGGALFCNQLTLLCCYKTSAGIIASDLDRNVRITVWSGHTIILQISLPVCLLPSTVPSDYPQPHAGLLLNMEAVALHWGTACDKKRLQATYTLRKTSA